MTITGPGANQITVSGNGSYHVFMIFSGTVNISGLTIANGNDGGGAGAGIMNFGTLTVTSCTFTGNHASYGGGAIANDGTLVVNDSTFSGNYGYYGGGAIANLYGTSSGPITVINSTFFGNTTSGAGSAIDQQGGPITVINSTFSGNFGGAITNEGGSLTIANSIVSGNSGGDVNNGYTDNGGNLIGGSANLAPLGNYGGTTQTMLPLAGSPATCAGLAANLPPGNTDQRSWPATPSTCPFGPNGQEVDAGAVQTNYRTVNTLGDTSNTSDLTSCSDGTESATNTCSLRDALTQANTATMADVAFAPSLFLVGTSSVPTLQTITPNTLLPYITGQLNLVGPGANLLTISGNSPGAAGSVLTVENTAVAFIEGLAIANGNGSEGGGIFNNNGTLTVADSTVSGNSAVSGGGGIFNNYGGTLTLTNSTVSGNSTPWYGGGIYSQGGKLTVSNSTVFGNTVSAGGGEGGGVFISGGTLTVSNSTVSGNTVGSSGGNAFGGGIFASGRLTLTNSIVAGNTTNGTVNSDDCDSCGTQSSFNLIGLPTGVTSINQILGSLAYSPAAATVQTMMPMPQPNTTLNPITCQGSASLLPAGVVTDERGFPMDPQCPSVSIDLGAVQTNFTQGISMGYNGVVNQTISPSPWTQLQETNATTQVIDGVGGIPITIVIGPQGTPWSGNPTVTTAPTLTANGIDNLAVYPGIVVNAPGADSFAPVINGIYPGAYTFGLSIMSFNIDAATPAQLAIAPLQNPTITAGGNAGIVSVMEESSPDGLLITSATDSITLSVLWPDGTQHAYPPATASGGIATFDLTTYPLTEAGIYSYSAVLTANPSVGMPPIPLIVTPLTVPASLTVFGYPITQYVGVAGTVTVEALDTYGNLVTAFNGPVNISTSDTTAIITSNPLTLSSGAGTVTVTFNTAGTQSITASATGLVSGSETNIQVTLPPSFVVTVATDTTGACTDQGQPNATLDASCSLRDALTAAQNAGVGNITFASAHGQTFATAQEISLTNGALNVYPLTTITGPTTGSGATLTNLVTVDGGGAVSVFYIPMSPAFPGVTISNLNIADGNGTCENDGDCDDAGGVNNWGTLTLNNCAFTSNTGDDAGAIMNWDGGLTVNNTTFNGNTGTNGGELSTGAIAGPNANWVFGEGDATPARGVHPATAAVHHASAQPAYLKPPTAAMKEHLSSTLARHAALRSQDCISGFAAKPRGSAGGGCASSPAYALITINNSTFTNNSGYGTGALYSTGDVAITGSTFKSNNALYGVGALVSDFDGGGPGDYDDGVMTVANSTFTSNTAPVAGAVANVDGAKLTVTGSTFNGNISSGNSDYSDAGAINSFFEATTYLAYNTFYNNSSTSVGRGSGAIFGYETYLGLLGNTITGNSGYYGAIYDWDSDGSNLANSIVSGNTTTDSNSPGDGISPDQNGMNVNKGNVISSTAISLAPFANYGGTTLTMIPLPGSAAICAGSINMINRADEWYSTTITTDQRGLPNTTTYAGYTGNSPCVDSGAVQTNYALAFTTQPPTSVYPSDNFGAAVTLTESGIPFLPSVSVPLALASGDPGTLSGGSASTASGVATYSSLQVSAPGTGDMLNANLSLNATLTVPLSLSATSNAFGVTASGFTIAIAGPSSGTVLPGGSITYKVTVTPQFTNYGGPVTFTISSGLPPGATATFNPTSIPANGGAQTVTVTIKTAAPAAQLQQQLPKQLAGRGAPWALALLLLPLAGARKLRRGMCGLTLLVAIAAAGVLAGLSGCASNSAGFFAQQPQGYTVVVTATSAGTQHSTSFTLNVQ
jgi:CSLREA domain-containing protein